MRQMTLIAFLQAQNCTNFASSWRHPQSRTDTWSADYYRHVGRVLEDLVRTSPSLAAIFTLGERIRNPWVPGDDTEEPFNGQRFPSQTCECAPWLTAPQ